MQAQRNKPLSALEQESVVRAVGHLTNEAARLADQTSGCSRLLIVYVETARALKRIGGDR